jgi:hypothetical protein
MDLGNGHVKDFKTQLSQEAKSLREDPRFPDVTPLEEGLQHDKISNHYYPYSLPEYILPIDARPTHYKPDLIREIGYYINSQGRLEEDNTYTGRRRFQIIECKYSTDTNILEVIDHILNIYEPLRQAMYMHATGEWKADIEIIPIVISRTGSFHTKTLAAIAQLISFQEEPPDTLTYKQLSPPARDIVMALHIHAQEWLTPMSKLSRNILLSPRPKPSQP